MDSASQNPNPTDPPALGIEQTWTVRTTHRPHIVCPSWCVVPETDHLDHLASLDGGVLHTSDWVSVVADGSFAVQLVAAQLIDGAPDPEDPDILVRLTATREEGYTLRQATTVAAQLTKHLGRLHSRS